MGRILVGQSSLSGTIESYSERFGLVEVTPIEQPLPKGARLRAWRKKAPPGFVFSVVLPRVVGSLAASPEAEGALVEALGAARLLEARAVVLRTPASVRPTSSNKKRIEALLARVPEEGVLRAWEPSGLWERDEAVVFARSIGVACVLDGTQEKLPPGPAVYTRLRDAGGLRVSSGALDALAKQLAGRREAFVVVEAPRAARAVKKFLAEHVAPPPVRRAAALAQRPPHPALIAEDEEQ